ncbi:hypothetical protein KIPB_016858, partial [Kipferlia bialata]|eukprot:g16858.t1
MSKPTTSSQDVSPCAADEIWRSAIKAEITSEIEWSKRWT